jgi:hypothetical protein
MPHLNTSLDRVILVETQNVHTRRLPRLIEDIVLFFATRNAVMGGAHRRPTPAALPPVDQPSIDIHTQNRSLFIGSGYGVRSRANDLRGRRATGLHQPAVVLTGFEPVCPE